MPRSSANRKKLRTAVQTPRARIIISNLRRENVFLLKTLNDLAQHHNDHNRIIERFLALIPYRPSSQEYEAEDANCNPVLMPEEQRCNEENQCDVVNLRRLACYANEIAEIKDQLVSISARCQYLQNNSAREQDCAVDVQGNNDIITELQISLSDAIDKNKQWVEYDQQRELYVKSILTRMLWLEKHLHEVSETRVAERKDFLSDEKKKLKQMEQYYEELMQKAGQELDILREQVCLIQAVLSQAQRECRENQLELNELREQLQPDRNTPNPVDIRREDEEEYLTTEAEVLHVRLNKERRKSATLELQSGHLQKYFLNHYHKAQRQIAKFKRMIEILLQDLHDERENCSYLKQQLELVQAQTEEKERTEKTDNPTLNLAQPSDLPPLPPKTRGPVSPHKSVLEESFMECPMCHAAYPASQYNELIEHLDYCQI